MSRYIYIISIFICLVLSACGPAEPEDFNRSCTVDADCIVVSLARDCECGVTTGVNKSEEKAVRESNQQEYETEWCPFGSVDCDQAAMDAFCGNNTCQTRPSQNFDG